MKANEIIKQYNELLKNMKSLGFENPKESLNDIQNTNYILEYKADSIEKYMYDSMQLTKLGFNVAVLTIEPKVQIQIGL